MDYFHYQNRLLHCEDVPVPALAERYGTPLYVYSQRTLLHHLTQLQKAFAAVSPLICYSVKTNGNLHICRLMAEHGSGFDVTSGGELYRALKAGGTGEKIVFAGVGKTADEFRTALENKVKLFNVESEAELHALAGVASKLGTTAPVALRVNPSLPPKTHVKTDTSVKGTKFGLDIETILDVAKTVVGKPGVRVVGLHMHLGSPIITTQPYKEGVEKGLVLIEKLRQQGHPIEYLNMGGGFGIHYRKQEAPPADAFAEVIVPAVQKCGCKLILEPGRFIVGNAGILVSRVLYTKESGGKHFVIQDAAMNDLVRPTLYDSFHRIWPVQPAANVPAPPADYEAEIPGTARTDVVGPVCESGDFLAKDRHLPPLQTGELLATFSAGAYGMAMSSNYNGRPRAAEVLVDGAKHRLIRRRETYEDLIRPEVEV
ncbi:diaminopimelate decarboxylase [Planctomycetaceae bacterium SCGC AG-212-F19]|nr:diaminopimelate decarboxylase [Planctomycetaceae bacterium SCGC AG-212-F19]